MLFGCSLPLLGLPRFNQHSTFALHEIIHIHLLDLYWSIVCLYDYPKTFLPSFATDNNAINIRLGKLTLKKPTANTYTHTHQSNHHGLVRRIFLATHASSSRSLTRRRLHSTRPHRSRTVLGWPRQFLQVPRPPQHHRQRTGRREGEEGLCAGAEGVRERMRK